MLCSGGGGRAEYGALKYFNEFWASDNTDPVERIFIQWGYSYFFPAGAVCDHVTNWGNESLKFKIDVAMQGKLGFDININKLSEKEIQFCRNAVDNYKRLQDVLNYGSLYRLIAPYKSSIAALMYVDSSRKKAVVFDYNMNVHHGDTYQNIILQGLNPAARYVIKEINVEEGKRNSFRQSGKIYTGDFLMKEGIGWYLNGALTSSILEVTEVE
jgi:alpha-galactosidase